MLRESSVGTWVLCMGAPRHTCAFGVHCRPSGRGRLRLYCVMPAPCLCVSDAPCTALELTLAWGWMQPSSPMASLEESLLKALIATHAQKANLHVAERALTLKASESRRATSESGKPMDDDGDDEGKHKSVTKGTKARVPHPPSSLAGAWVVVTLHSVCHWRGALP
jgi:hypothetical protein